MNEPLPAVPCIVCKKALNSVPSGSHNHADNANSFRATGQYGSTVFDPVDGSYLEVNICDPCIVDAAKSGLVLRSRGRVMRNDLKPWNPEKD